MYQAGFTYKPHFPVIISPERVHRHAGAAKPKELRTFIGGSSGKFEQLAITEIAEFCGAARIVTLGNHEEVADFGGYKMDARKICNDACRDWMHLYCAAHESSGTDTESNRKN